jgi:cell fate (sporulation/competence/biofilm development) regulator YlbF (YheA/YmcA/DUF963 family)
MRGDSNLTDSKFLKAQKTFQKKQKKFFHDYEQKHKLEFMKKKLKLWEKLINWFRKK